jgi:hypothetical protein
VIFCSIIKAFHKKWLLEHAVFAVVVVAAVAVVDFSTSFFELKIVPEKSKLSSGEKTIARLCNDRPCAFNLGSILEKFLDVF